ncbi:MAG TPA: hypothetical protein VF157_15915, partial [Chloroflexota bacterium]
TEPPFEPLPTHQPCEVVPQVVAIAAGAAEQSGQSFARAVHELVYNDLSGRAETTEKWTRVMVAPNGHRVMLQAIEKGGWLLEHRNERQEVVQRTCAGACGTGDQRRTVGPIDCPDSKSPFLDCTVDPPTLKCV